MGNFVPDVALIDLGLPLMDGYQLARWLREQPQCRDIILIAQTGWGREEDRKRAREAGFDHSSCEADRSPAASGDFGRCFKQETLGCLVLSALLERSC